MTRSIAAIRRLSAIMLAASLLLAGCRQGAEDGAPNAADASDDAVTNLPAMPLPEPPLDRAGLLAAAARAASAAAAGRPIDQRALDGRQFELRIRFGCRGPTETLDQEWLGWAFDPERQRLRVRARPTITAQEPLVQALAGDTYEAVEGFFIPRPWLLDAVCPAAQPKPMPDKEEAPPAETAAPAPQSEPLPRAPRIGIAQFFTETDPRTGRRGDRPFESIQALEEGQAPDGQGFTLVLSGRLSALPGAGVIACTRGDAVTPPECIASADFDRVWIEKPGTSEIVAEWRTG